jgi:hypothetical protein
MLATIFYSASVYCKEKKYIHKKQYNGQDYALLIAATCLEDPETDVLVEQEMKKWVQKCLKQFKYIEEMEVIKWLLEVEVDSGLLNLMNKQMQKKIIMQDGKALQYAEESLKKDQETVQLAVKQNGDALKYADEFFKKDKETVQLAVKQNGMALQYADESLKKDKETVQMAVKQNGVALVLADEFFKKDKETVQMAVKQNGVALVLADESFKKDKETVQLAVKQDGMVLQYADESFKKDKETVQLAVKQDGMALQYADESFKKDKETVQLALESNGSILCKLDGSLKIDTLIIQKALVSSLGHSVHCLQPTQKQDEKLALLALAANQYYLSYFKTQSPELREFAVPFLKIRLQEMKEDKKEYFEGWKENNQKNDLVLRMIDFDLWYNKAFLRKASTFYPAAKVWLERL